MSFIVIEGLDGSGKTTQLQLLAQKLEGALLTREPTDNPIGSLCRRSFAGDIALGRRALILSLIADRIEHVEKCIRPALESGQIVICDRYYLSNMAYQGGEGFSVEEIYGLNKQFFVPSPDLCIYLDISPFKALERIRERRGEAAVFDNLKSLETISANYNAAIEFLKAGGENIVTVSADKERESLGDEIFGLINALQSK